MRRRRRLCLVKRISRKRERARASVGDRLSFFNAEIRRQSTFRALTLKDIHTLTDALCPPPQICKSSPFPTPLRALSRLPSPAPCLPCPSLFSSSHLSHALALPARSLALPSSPNGSRQTHTHSTVDQTLPPLSSHISHYDRVDTAARRIWTGRGLTSSLSSSAIR